MDKISTPQLSLPVTLSENNRKRPSALTLAVIRQFARTYHVEQRLNRTINNVILN